MSYVSCVLEVDGGEVFCGIPVLGGHFLLPVNKNVVYVVWVVSVMSLQLLWYACEDGLVPMLQVGCGCEGNLCIEIVIIHYCTCNNTQILHCKLC